MGVIASQVTDPRSAVDDIDEPEVLGHAQVGGGQWPAATRACGRAGALQADGAAHQEDEQADADQDDGHGMWPQQLSSLTMTGRVAKERLAAIHMSSRTRKTTTQTIMTPMSAVAKTGTWTQCGHRRL